MPQSLARLYIRLVFSTSLRTRVLSGTIRDPLHRYIAVVINNHRCHSLLINSVEDHTHILFDLHRAIALGDIVQEIKTSSSKWIKTQGSQFGLFSWQARCGAFGVEVRSVSAARDYITIQQGHHRIETFQEEFRWLLADNDIEFDERYVWG